MNDIRCPYCQALQEINHDDGAGYAEDTIHQQQCSECEKTFIFTTSIHYSYDPQKADCLNRAEHNLKLTSTYPPEFARRRCTVCGYEAAKGDK